MPVETAVQNLERRPENTPNQELTRENIELYVRGCAEVALRLSSAIEKIAKEGKKPIILIPSRGAVPIFLIAKQILNDLDPDNSPLSDRKANYYPNGVFEYLEGKEPKPNGPEARCDVVLYPFTADVSAEGKHEWLARELRESCAKAVLELLDKTPAGNDQNLDLAWYEFILRKMSDRTDNSAPFQPAQIIKSLESIPNYEEGFQIILIDTVISGRAARDITAAFESLDHKVFPILAVDNSSGGRFQPKKKSEIEQSSNWDYLPDEKPDEETADAYFVYFPLLTEDKGSALLGVSAVNFSCFNEKGIFAKVDPRFSPDFTPQSCIWSLPTRSLEEKHRTFQKFLEIAWSIYNKEPVDKQAFTRFQKATHDFTASHGKISLSELAGIMQVPPKTEARETASHIVSVKLPNGYREQWIKEFAAGLVSVEQTPAK